MEREMKVSNRNWKRLQQWAIPFEDSPDDALGRVLDMAEARRNTPDSDLEVIPDHSHSNDHIPLQIVHSSGKEITLGPGNDDSIPIKEISHGPGIRKQRPHLRN